MKATQRLLSYLSTSTPAIAAALVAIAMIATSCHQPGETRVKASVTVPAQQPVPAIVISVTPAKAAASEIKLVPATKAEGAPPAKATPSPAKPAPKPSTPAAPAPAKSPTALLSNDLRNKVEPLLLPGKPLLWVNQDTQTFLVVIRKGDDADVVLEGKCTTGRNSAEGGESLPTPSTVSKDGSVQFTTIIRKDAVRPGIGLRNAMELDFRDTRGDLRSICVHAGKLREYPASHGCIRVSDEDAAALFALMQKGDRVVITGVAESDNRYLTYVATRTGEKVPVFKCVAPGATQADIDAFVDLLKRRGVPLDNSPTEALAKARKTTGDKNLLRFRFEHMPRGTGVTVAEVEKMTGRTMQIGPVTVANRP